MIEYELIRSNRKTLTIQVKPDGSVIVRAPVRLAKYRIAKFVKDHETWIFAQQEKLEKYACDHRRRASGRNFAGKKDLS